MPGPDDTPRPRPTGSVEAVAIPRDPTTFNGQPVDEKKNARLLALVLDQDWPPPSTGLVTAEEAGRSLHDPQSIARGLGNIARLEESGELPPGAFQAQLRREVGNGNERVLMRFEREGLLPPGTVAEAMTPLTTMVGGHGYQSQQPLSGHSFRSQQPMAEPPTEASED